MKLCPDAWTLPALLKHLVDEMKQSPRPSIVDCRAGGACLASACHHTGSLNTHTRTHAAPADYLSPAAFSVNLLKCMSNDWQLDASELLRLIFPSSVKLTGKAAGVEVSLDNVEQELQREPTSLQVIINAYSRLVKEAKQKRAPGDPWPIIIIDEANRLQEWEDTKALNTLLAFFVYLTKQEKLAHVVLATSDTFLSQWLQRGVCALPLAKAHVFSLLPCTSVAHPRSVLCPAQAP